MSFLYPAFLAGALAIAIPIALHFLRRDVAPEVPFTAVRLLRRSPLEQTRRKRLRDHRRSSADVEAWRHHRFCACLSRRWQRALT